MIEAVGDRLDVSLECDEVEQVMVLVQPADDLNGCPVIVAVEAFAGVAVVGDEVAGAEDEIVFRDADGIALGGHGGHPGGRPIGLGKGNWMIFCRRATNKLATTRSAVVPGLIPWLFLPGSVW